MMAGLKLLAPIAALMFWGAAALADSRDDTYQALLTEAGALASVDLNASGGLRALRSQAVRVARGIKLFAISETEARSDDKVSPPPGLLTRAGVDEEGGSTAALPISEVPTPWFNARITEARDGVRGLIARLDGGQGDSAELSALANQTYTALHALSRP